MMFSMKHAFDAVEELRAEVHRRFGARLQHDMLVRLDTIEATLLQAPSAHDTVAALKQRQAELDEGFLTTREPGEDGDES